jgi:hypothetical protein
LLKNRNGVIYGKNAVLSYKIVFLFFINISGGLKCFLNFFYDVNKKKKRFLFSGNERKK